MTIAQQIREEVIENVEVLKAMRLISRATVEMLEYAIENNLATPCNGSDLIN